MKNLEGKNILITGAATGIGAATAIRFAKEGSNVAINYLHDENLGEVEKVVKKIKETKKDSNVIKVKADISSEEQVKEMFRKVLDEWDKIDVLVNNAGIQINEKSHEVSLENFRKVIDVNLQGTFICSREAIKHFLKKGGGIILNNSSVHEILPKPEYVGYPVSKGGIKNLTTTLALEYADKGIRVNAVAPGVVDTPMNPWYGNSESKNEAGKGVPVKRVGEPEEIAAAFAFLASEDASYITGQTLFVDGGLTLSPEPPKK